MPVLKNMSKAHQDIRVAFNYDNCVVIKYPFKEHIPPQTTMEAEPSFLPASSVNNSESLCGMNQWFNNEHQQSSPIIALILLRWGEVHEEEGVSLYSGPPWVWACILWFETHELPSTGFPRNGCILFLLWKLSKNPSLYDTKPLSIAGTNKQLSGQDRYTDVKRHPSFSVFFCSAWG